MPWGTAKHDDGIVTDARLRTSDPHIYAAGDVANAHHPLLDRHVRVEHWANALNGGPAAARSMLGGQAEYARLPYFFSDQYDLGMEYSGWGAPGGGFFDFRLTASQLAGLNIIPGRYLVDFLVTDGFNRPVGDGFFDALVEFLLG